jgi:hypothetical protein
MKKRLCFLAGLVMAAIFTLITVPSTNALVLDNWANGPPTINATLSPMNLVNNTVAFHRAHCIAGNIDNPTMISPPGARTVGNVYNELNPAATWEAGLHANNVLNGTGMYTNSSSNHVAMRLASCVNTVRRYDNANAWTGNKAVMKRPNASKKMNGAQIAAATNEANDRAANPTTWTGNVHT